jgi:protein-disulfide isomerase
VEEKAKQRDRAALGWFGLGILIGAVATLGVISLTNLPQSAPASASASATETDLKAIREAAMQGARDALLTANTGATSTVSLDDIRDAARQGAAQALQDAPQLQQQAQVEPTPAPVDPSSIAIRAANTKGDVNAKVSIVEYSDFQCPYCRRFYEQVLPRILEDYVKTGKVRLTFKHYAFLGEESRWAAQASECAAEQGKFWEYHDVLYSQNTGTPAFFSKSNLAQLADQIKLDGAAYAKCVDDAAILARLQEDADEGSRIGVRGTPTFLVNGKILVGAQPFEAFQAAIEEALKAAQ